MFMYGLGKKRSEFGRYIDRLDITQGELIKLSGVSKNVITRACNGEDIRDISKSLLVKATNKLTGENKKVSDFW